MVKAVKVIIAALIATAFPMASHAATSELGINQRQQNQQQRIQQGWRSGDLTTDEYRYLQGAARDIEREEWHYRSDGRLSQRERADLNRELNRLSGAIERERHDGQQRFDNRDFSHEYSGYDISWFRDSGPREIDRLQELQRERILQGIRSGELTHIEASRLIAEQRMIQQQEQDYWADGMLTRNEQLELLHNLNAAGRRIYNETHDAQDRR